MDDYPLSESWTPEAKLAYAIGAKDGARIALQAARTEAFWRPGDEERGHRVPNEARERVRVRIDALLAELERQ